MIEKILITLVLIVAFYIIVRFILKRLCVNDSLDSCSCCANCDLKARGKKACNSSMHDQAYQSAPIAKKEKGDG